MRNVGRARWLPFGADRIAAVASRPCKDTVAEAETGSAFIAALRDDIRYPSKPRIGDISGLGPVFKCSGIWLGKKFLVT